MESILAFLQGVIKVITTIVELLGKIPDSIIWIIKLIPGVSPILNSLDGFKTVLFNVVSGVLIFLEGNDWTAIGEWICKVVEWVVHFWSSGYVCNGSFLNELAMALIILGNLILRLKTNSVVSPKIAPIKL